MKTSLPLSLRLLGVALALVTLAHPLRAMTEQERRAHLEWMLKSLPNAPQFNQWQQRTGELPPDFDALPRNNFLPDPLTFMNGWTVRNASDWTARRAESSCLARRRASAGAFAALYRPFPSRTPLMKRGRLSRVGPGAPRTPGIHSAYAIS